MKPQRALIARNRNSDPGKTITNSEFITELALLFDTDSKAYGSYVRSVMLIEAETEAAKIRIEYAARISRHIMKAETKRIMKGVYDG